MRAKRLKPGLLIAALIVSSVASARPPQRMKNVKADAETLAKIHSVLVIRFPATFDYRVTDLNVDMSRGLIGRMVDSAEKKRREELAAKLKQNDQGFSRRFADAIAKQLTEEGYEVTVQDGPWGNAADGTFVLATDQLPTESDSVLTIQLNFVGFAIEPTALKSLFGAYRPWLTCEIRLLRGRDHEVLYRGLHSGGLKLRGKEWKSIPLEKSFASIEAIEKEFASAVASLDDTASAVAVSLREDLRRTAR